MRSNVSNILTKPFKRFESEAKDTNGFAYTFILVERRWEIKIWQRWISSQDLRTSVKRPIKCNQIFSSFLPAFSTPIFPSHQPRSSVFFCPGFFSEALVRLLRSLEKERTATQASFNSVKHFLVNNWWTKFRLATYHDKLLLFICRSTRWMLPLLNGIEPCSISVQTVE